MSLKPDRVSLTASKLFSQALNLMWSESTFTWPWPHVTFIIATLFSRQGHPSHSFPSGHLRSKILNYFLRGIWYERKFNFDPIAVKFGNHDLMTHFYESQVLVILMSHIISSFWKSSISFSLISSSHSSRVAPITKYSILIGRDKRRRERRIRCVGVSRKDSSERRLIFLYYVTFKREIQQK